MDLYYKIKDALSSLNGPMDALQDTPILGVLMMKSYMTLYIDEDHMDEVKENFKPHWSNSHGYYLLFGFKVRLMVYDTVFFLNQMM